MSSTCILSGTPIADQPQTNYTITGSNSYGTVTQVITIGVDSNPPSSLTFPNGTYTFTKDAEVSPVTPTYDGTLTSCSASPSLPSGLSINNLTCEITGTPTAITGTNTYTITATNPNGSTSSVVSITVNDVPPTFLSYSGGGTYTYEQGTAITPIDPIVTGTPTGYSVSPTLPAGLSIDPSTGQISGTPTVITPTGTYTVTASNTGGSTTYNLTITITNSLPVVNFGQATYSISENAGSLLIPVNLSVTTSVDVVVPITYIYTTAEGSDITETTNVTITAGNVSADLSISITGDSVYEGDETFDVVMGTPTNASKGTTTTSTITITNDDPTPTLIFGGGSSSVTEGASLTVPITLNTVSGVDTVVTITYTNGTASSGDYTSTTTEVTILAGQTSVDLTIPTTLDLSQESDETFTVGLSSPDATGTPSQTFTINDLSASFETTASTVQESAGTLTLPVTLSQAVPTGAGPYTVTYTTAGTASNGTDYTISGTLQFSATEQTKNITIIITDDTNFEPSETISIDLSSTDVGIGPNITYTYTITDNDDPLQISSAETIDFDSDGFIDHYKITFNKAVTDSTYDYTKWSLDGGNYTLGSGGSSLIYGDTANDNVLYIPINEGSIAAPTSPDTDVKPDITIADTTVAITAADGDGLRGGTVGSYTTTITTFDVTEADRALPVVISAVGYENSNKLTVTFSEAVYSDSGASACGSGGEFDNGLTQEVYNGGSTGATAISAIGTDSCAVDDKVVTYTLDTNLVIADDNGVDTISYNTVDKVYDAAANIMNSSQSVTVNNALPVITISSIIVYDGTTPVAGIDSDDYVILTFSDEFANYDQITKDNINDYFTLSNGHTWGTIESISWLDSGGSSCTPATQTCVSIRVDYGSTTGGASIAPGDTVTIADPTSPDYPELVNTTDTVSTGQTGTVSGSFDTDNNPLYLSFVVEVDYINGIIVLKFSKDVVMDSGTNGALNPANYTLNGSALPSGTITSLAGELVKIDLDSGLTLGASYTIRASTSIKDLSGNNLIPPDSVTFEAGEPLKVVFAESLSTTKVRVYFNKFVKSDINAANSATCDTATECNKRYKLYPDLGNITSVVVDVDTNLPFYVDLTHTNQQAGNAYALIAANPSTTDNGTCISGGACATFNTSASDSIQQTDGTDMQGNPFDRAIFQGSGTPVISFADGWFMDDPFLDGSVFSFTFEYKDKVYVGPNQYNNSTLRFDTNGNNVISNTFSASGLTSSSCPTTNGFGYGFYDTASDNTCTGPGTDEYGGPYQDRGMVGFTSANIAGEEILTFGPVKGGPDWGYFTQDLDLQIDLGQINYQNYTAGGNTKSIQTYYSDGSNLYGGFACNHGTQAPIMIRNPATITGGVVSFAQTKNATVNLDLDSEAIGKTYSGVTWVNAADAIGIDSILEVTLPGQSPRTYIANSVSMISSLDITVAANKLAFDISEPSGIRTLGQTNIVLPGIPPGGSYPQGLLKVSPGQRGMPFLRFHNNKLYVVRNVALDSSHSTGAITEGNKIWNYGEIYVCGSPTGGTFGSLYCNGSDWSLVFTTNSAVSDITRFDSTKSDNKAISMFEITPEGVVYIGTDSPSGFRVYRNTARGADITNSGWTQEGTDGLGTCSDTCYTHIQSSTWALQDGTTDTYYVYITAGKFTYDDNLWQVPIKVFRQADKGTSRMAKFENILQYNNNLLAYMKGHSDASAMWIAIIITFVGLSIGFFIHLHYKNTA